MIEYLQNMNIFGSMESSTCGVSIEKEKRFQKSADLIIYACKHVMTEGEIVIYYKRVYFSKKSYKLWMNMLKICLNVLKMKFIWFCFYILVF